MFLACDAPPEPVEEEETPASSPVSSTGGGGGGGDIDIRPDPAGKMTARPYERALDHINNEEFDEAHELLQAELHHGEEDPQTVKAQMLVAEQGLMKQPTSTVADVLSREKTVFEERVSIRGRFVEGGVIGQQSHYFWVYDGNRIKCRYHKLRIQDRSRIVQVKEGTLVLVRGTVRSAGADGGAAYLEVSFFRTLQPGGKQVSASGELR